MQKKRNTKRCKDKKKLPTTSRDNGISIIFQEKERERGQSSQTLKVTIFAIIKVILV